MFYLKKMAVFAKPQPLRCFSLLENIKHLMYNGTHAKIAGYSRKWFIP